MSFIVIYSTYPDLKTAKRINTELLKKRLIACVNYFPMESAYWWKGKIENAKEIVALVKTRKQNWAKVKSAIETLHPYETPCIIKMSVSSNAPYARWIMRETK